MRRDVLHLNTLLIVISGFGFRNRKEATVALRELKENGGIPNFLTNVAGQLGRRGHKMKIILNIMFSAVLFLTLAGMSRADTYAIDQTLGSGDGEGSVVGTISTDGTYGVLTPANITFYSLTLTANAFFGWPLSSTTLTPSNSTVSSGDNTGDLDNVDLTATATSLLFNFSGSDAGSWDFSGATGQLCLTSYTNCSVYYPASAIGTNDVGGNGRLSIFSPESGNQVIGTAVPEPSSLSMFGAMLCAVGAFGKQMKRLKARQLIT